MPCNTSQTLAQQLNDYQELQKCLQNGPLPKKANSRFGYTLKHLQVQTHPSLPCDALYPQLNGIKSGWIACQEGHRLIVDEHLNLGKHDDLQQGELTDGQKTWRFTRLDNENVHLVVTCEAQDSDATHTFITKLVTHICNDERHQLQYERYYHFDNLDNHALGTTIRACHARLIAVTDLKQGGQ